MQARLKWRDQHVQLNRLSLGGWGNLWIPVERVGCAALQLQDRWERLELLKYRVILLERLLTSTFSNLYLTHCFMAVAAAASALSGCTSCCMVISKQPLPARAQRMLVLVLCIVGWLFWLRILNCVCYTPRKWAIVSTHDSVHSSINKSYFGKERKV